MNRQPPRRPYGNSNLGPAQCPEREDRCPLCDRPQAWLHPWHWYSCQSPMERAASSRRKRNAPKASQPLALEFVRVADL